MKKLLLPALASALLLATLLTGGEPMAAGVSKNDNPYLAPGQYEPWQCAFERDHVPPLAPQAERMFLKARELQRRPYLSDVEKEEVFTLYKQAAERGHWRAMSNLAGCYMDGCGTTPSITSADAMFNSMMRRGIPIGFYGKYVLTAQGRGVIQDKAEAMRLLHKAADLGSPHAQYSLGEYYIYKQSRDRQGLAYHVCAARQGHAESAYAIGAYLEILDENFLMAAEYYLRSAALGEGAGGRALEEAFHPASKDSSPRVNFGFAPDQELNTMFAGLRGKLKKDPTAKFPELLKLKLPENTLMTREESRDMDSALRLEDRRWPDEVYPEFDPDYLQPRY